MQEILERLLFLQQFGNLLSQELRDEVHELFEAIVDELYRFDPTGVQRRYRVGRRTAFLGSVADKVREWLPGADRLIRNRLAVLGRQQAVVAEKSLVATLGTVDLDDKVRHTPITQQRLRAILNTEPFEGRVLAGHTEKLGANVVDRIGVQLRLGMAREEPVDDLVRRIRGRRAGRGFTGGVMRTTTREAEALVRTAVTFTANRGMMGTFRENAEILSGVRYVATLDDRTTLICLSLDGQTWDLDDPEVVIPGEATHFGCRSILVPVVDWAKLGFDAPPPGDRIARDLSGLTEKQFDHAISTRRSRGEFGDVERINSNTLATQWLRGQPERVQDEIMGPRRAELFRSGEVSLKQMVTGDLRVVNLNELAGDR